MVGGEKVKRRGEKRRQRGEGEGWWFRLDGKWDKEVFKRQMRKERRTVRRRRRKKRKGLDVAVFDVSARREQRIKYCEIKWKRKLKSENCLCIQFRLEKKLCVFFLKNIVLASLWVISWYNSAPIGIKGNGMENADKSTCVGTFLGRPGNVTVLRVMFIFLYWHKLNVCVWVGGSGWVGGWMRHF